MPNLGVELHLRRLVGVLIGQYDVNLKDPSLVDRIRLGGGHDS